jgi:hypothetical protein
VRRRVLELPAGGIAVLRVAGEIDMRTYTILRAAPDAARDSAGSRPANRCAGSSSISPVSRSAVSADSHCPPMPLSRSPPRALAMPSVRCLPT